GSAINGTLFSSAHFAKGMLSDGLLPDQLGTSDTSGIPTQTALVLGGAAAALTFLGSLEAITSFGSLAFMVVFGSMSYLAFRQRDDDRVSAVVPAVGVIGTVGLFPLLLYHLYAEQLSVFTTVLVLAVGILVLELVYFERDAIEDGISTVEKRI
ncbi:MAG: amino acid transporter, partial [Halorientalis sp.]